MTSSPVIPDPIGDPGPFFPSPYPRIESGAGSLPEGEGATQKTTTLAPRPRSGSRAASGFLPSISDRGERSEGK